MKMRSMSAAAIALNRFGLGARPDEPAPAPAGAAPTSEFVLTGPCVKLW